MLYRRLKLSPLVPVTPEQVKMTADEILLLCALLEDTGCSDAMVLMVAALYRPPVERPVVPNIRFCITATTDVDAEFDFRFDVAGILQLSSLFELPEWVMTRGRKR
ncbi:hypothetical protein PF005_g14207 [Phytophthora fragariae]|uniref:Uncharacterized protein n=2 Tax=Phytophthora fragariae TaxID=53985 RepID=A0A6A3RSV0_9STRA|nr:hypothetical protein PF009_g15492 [Phytophthora fragariae]KAE9103317.1 hypothetical protein PF007_g14455 [Phytophthora fragariae]KAE9141038.1 hypothetical protein PF006_g13384 [Phytophthora fragariae]KAE9203417.1 hypothetical protein PF005_g14207 [Phytophthora fragariae]KAE9221311.1 hypothetical protein PF002_g15631 [Phytophthora fragariae]